MSGKALWTGSKSLLGHMWPVGLSLPTSGLKQRSNHCDVSHLVWISDAFFFFWFLFPSFHCRVCAFSLYHFSSVLSLVFPSSTLSLLHVLFWPTVFFVHADTKCHFPHSCLWPHPSYGDICQGRTPFNVTLHSFAALNCPLQDFFFFLTK